jgi:hypothetical protein
VVRTAYCGFLVLLEVVVDEAHYERGLFERLAFRISSFNREKRATFPTAASPKSTSFTLLLGFACAAVSAIARCAWYRSMQ